jgi:hypothetical protein
MHALLIMKEVGHIWQKLSAKERYKYDEGAKLDKQRFLDETEEFEWEIENAMNNKDLNQPSFDKIIEEIDESVDLRSYSEVDHQTSDCEMSKSDKIIPNDTQKLFQVCSNTSRLKLAYSVFSKMVRYLSVTFFLDASKSQKHRA